MGLHLIHKIKFRVRNLLICKKRLVICIMGKNKIHRVQFVFYRNGVGNQKKKVGAGIKLNPINRVSNASGNVNDQNYLL